MATRNLTSKFELIRSQLRRHTYPPNTSTSDSYNGKSGLLDKSEGDLELGATSPIGAGITHQLPPEWVDIVDDIQANLSEVKKLLIHLVGLHGKRLKVSFGDEIIREQEQEIEVETQQITALLRKSEAGVKRIASIGNSGNLPLQERTVRLNVMRSLAVELQNISKKFRTAQKDFLKALKEQESITSSFGFEDADSKTALTLDDALDQGLSSEQLQQMNEIKAKATEREREIITIAQSVNDLASLFKELNVLVIEQGTILDRIDYNIEQTLTKVQQGNKELTDANEYSKKSYTMKCILLLIVVVIILIAVLVWKKSS